MYTLAADEKTSLVLAYTGTTLVRGEVVTKQSIRVSTWLRMDPAPEYMHLLKAQVLDLLGGQVRSSAHTEIFLPTAQGSGFTWRLRHRIRWITMRAKRTGRWSR
jgi:hypothetical protein